MNYNVCYMSLVENINISLYDVFILLNHLLILIVVLFRSVSTEIGWDNHR